MKKYKQMEMITGYYIQPEKNEHFIFIKRVCETGEIFYSKYECFNADFYIRMMEIEFNMRTIKYK